MPRIYDVHSDQMRDATQEDIDRMLTCTQAFAGLVTFLHKSGRVRDGEAAEVAVGQSQGKLDPLEARKAYRRLLDSD
ncbi:MAG TPA: hypothetical protein VHU42_18215 [Rhodopila sp.]|jgi:hypothetical protein|nr:hypothetical protein [Rhodopila sp.]